MSFPSRDLKRRFGKPFGFVVIGLIIGLVVCFLTSCDPGAVFEPGGEIGLSDPPAGPTETGPKGDEPGEPSTGSPAEAPSFLFIENTLGDTVGIFSGVTVGIGQTRDLGLVVASGSERTYAVVTGIEGPICDLGRFEIVGVRDDGTAGSNRGGLSPAAAREVSWREALEIVGRKAPGGLVPADDMTAWFRDACVTPGGERGRVLAWRVPFGPAGGRYVADVIVRGLAEGRGETKTYFELQGWPGESFRWANHSAVEVVP